MASRRPASSRRSESGEPQEGVRQTRSSARLAGVPEVRETSGQHFELAQRGKPRGIRKKSVESIDTNDFRDGSTMAIGIESDPLSEDPPENVAPEATEEGSKDVAEDGPRDVSEEGPRGTPDEDEQADLDPPDSFFQDGSARLQDMLEFDLPKLIRWCDKSYAAVKSLSHPEPSESELKDFYTARRFFRTAFHSVTGNSSSYIDTLLLNLPYDESTDARAVVQSTTRLANLISLLLFVVQVQITGQGMSSLVKELDEAFHVFFDIDFPGSLEAPLEEALNGNELALRARCYRLREAIDEFPDRKVLILASQLFCRQPATAVGAARKQLQGGPYKELGGFGKDADHDIEQSLHDQIASLLHVVSLPETSQIKYELEKFAPQEKLLSGLRAWTLSMYEVMKEASARKDSSPTQAAGDQEEEGLFVDDDRDEPAQESREQEEEGLFVDDDRDEPAQESREQEEEGLFVDDDGDEPSQRSQSVSDDYDRLPPPRTQPTLKRDRTSLCAMKEAERNTSADTRNQDQAEHTGSQVIIAASNTMQQLRAAQVLDSLGTANSRQHGTATRKRQRDDWDADFDPDDGSSEANHQLHNELRDSRRSPKQARLQGDASLARGSEPSAGDRPPQSSMQANDVRAMQAAALKNRRLNVERKPPRVRERWTNEDTARLVDLVSDPDLGCSWSAMEALARKEKLFSVPRNQQQIRDKARGLKTEFLQADVILPPGFDLVRLGQKERNQVLAAGYNPDRMEDDVGDNGQVINSRMRWE